MSNHGIFDTLRGVSNCLYSQSANPQAYSVNTEVNQFNSNGFQLGATYSASLNTNAEKYVSWTFRRSPKFVDVVTYTGNGVAGRTIAHSLGVVPGMMIVKRTNASSNWVVYHRSIGATKYLVLNTTSAEATASDNWNSTEPTSTQITFGVSTATNASGGTYVAYLFAHDSSTDGIIQCGSFTTDGSGDATVSLGWEPQYLMIKASSAVEGWNVSDTACGYSVTGARYLSPNTTAAEGSFTGSENGHRPTATGFVTTVLPPSTTYIYLAIRRPNKPPTVGTQVYSAIARTGTGAIAAITGVGFAPDLLLTGKRTGAAWGAAHDRLRGVGLLLGPWSTSSETTNSASVTSFTPDGVGVGADGTGFQSVNGSGITYANWCFKRAPGVFDVVCWTGAGSATPIEHGLGVKPELVITKSRNNASIWYVNIPDTANTLRLNVNVAWEVASARTASSSTFVPIIFNSGYTFVAYLFASKAGISKVGSYTGNATTNTINCGFTTGARFVLIKRTDSTGDWYVWDTVRGIIAGNDPYLLLNSTAAEVTSTDYIDPVSTGFELSSTAPAAINASGGSFIFLAFS